MPSRSGTSRGLAPSVGASLRRRAGRGSRAAGGLSRGSCGHLYQLLDCHGTAHHAGLHRRRAADRAVEAAASPVLPQDAYHLSHRQWVVSAEKITPCGTSRSRTREVRAITYDDNPTLADLTFAPALPAEVALDRIPKCWARSRAAPSSRRVQSRSPPVAVSSRPATNLSTRSSIAARSSAVAQPLASTLANATAKRALAPARHADVTAFPCVSAFS